MKITGDITNPRLLAAKGVLFVAAAAGAMAGVVVLSMQQGDWRLVAAMHVVGVWCACRSYYFAFYVIERYAGGGPYAGLMGAVRSAWGLMRNGRAG